MPASLSYLEYSIQPWEKEEIPAGRELVRIDPILFHPFLVMHNLHAFLAEVGQMQKQRSHLERAREQQQLAQQQADAKVG